MLSEDQVSSHDLNHLGLVAAVIDKIGLVKKIDERLPLEKNRGAKVSMGQRVAAMILNGLGFVENRLYIFPEFLENKPVKRLFGPEIEASDFNDDVLGRCLDEIYKYGVTKLFAEIAFSIGTTFGLLGKTARFDTTSLTVYGDYEDDEAESTTTSNQEPDPEEKDPFKITYGYSKDGRPDLKQVVLNLATTGKANLPIWMEPHSGNASDKVILERAAERMKKFASALKEAPSFLFVGDSAMYEKCVEDAGDMLWLSRVPHVLKKAQEVLVLEDEKLSWINLEKGYRVSHALEVKYKEVTQRWVIVSSEQMYKREVATLDKKIDKEQEEATKELWHLSNQIFACEKDAKKAIKLLGPKLKYHAVSWMIEPVSQHEGKGRPKKGSTPNVVGYQVKANLNRDEEKISLLHRAKGRFILATNQLDKTQLSEEDMLKEYKQQTHTEAGFRFIKGNAFEVAGVFLKKETRVQALMMVMTLCLMIYNLAQYFLREALLKNQDTVPNQLKKPTNKPTMAWICHLFCRIHIVYIRFEPQTQELVSNLTELLRRIIHYFGHVAEKIYGLSE